MSDSPISGIMSYGAGKWAAGKSLKATELSNETMMQMYQQSRGDIAPWMEHGEVALKELNTMMAEGPGEFVPSEDPGYKFGYEEFVEKPTLRGAAARGGLRSGATEKALTRYASDYASTKYDNFLNRYYNKLTPYQSMAGLGQTSAAQASQSALATGAITSQNYLTGNMAAINARLAGFSGLASGMSAGGQNALGYYSSLRRPATTGAGYGGGGSSYSNLVQTYGGVGR